MTKKELLRAKETYKELARDCMASDTPYPRIVGVCQAIAKTPDYNHHERGQQLWAFFQALAEIEEE